MDRVACLWYALPAIFTSQGEVWNYSNELPLIFTQSTLGCAV